MDTSELIAVLPGAVARTGLPQLEAEMLKHDQVQCDVVHHFGPGIYIREVSIPAGTFAIGHEQKCEHMNVMLKGRVLMVEDDGSTHELIAPLMFIGKPGRKMGLILEDMVWQNIYPTTERDIDALEKTYLNKSEAWQLNDAQRKKIDHIQCDADRCDFHLMLSEYGISGDLVKAQSENPDDQVQLHGATRFKVSDSQIHGKGVFATSVIDAGEVIAPARIDGMRTPVGRFTNHARNPNACMELLPSGDIQLVALRRIGGCMGGQDGEEITINYRDALRLSGIEKKFMEAS